MDKSQTFSKWKLNFLCIMPIFYIEIEKTYQVLHRQGPVELFLWAGIINDLSLQDFEF